jgi:hypothetical protein
MATKKITLNELKSLVKQVIKEEVDRVYNLEKTIFDALSEHVFYDYGRNKFIVDMGDNWGLTDEIDVVQWALDKEFDDKQIPKYNEIIKKWKETEINKKEEYHSNTEELPSKTLNLIKKCEEIFNCKIEIKDKVYLYDGSGSQIAVGPGVSVTHRTGSMSSGPSDDYSEEIFKFLKHNGFIKSNSYGDNGMDSATNHRDTYWTKEFIYKPKMKEFY